MVPRKMCHTDANNKNEAFRALGKGKLAPATDQGQRCVGGEGSV